MSFFPQTKAALLRGAVVRRAYLVEMQFASMTQRVWGGSGWLKTLDGKYWGGVGTLASIEGMESAIGTVNAPLKFLLSGVPKELIALATGQSAEYYMRPVVVWMQFFDPEWQPLDNPYARALGLMDTLEVSKKQSKDKKSWERSIALTAETLFFGRARPPGRQLTDRDQQTYWPGDRYCERISDLQYKVVHWPT